MTKTTTKLYNERMNLLLTTYEHTEPKRVPVFSQISSWAIDYYGKGTTYRDCLANPEWFAKEVSAKIYRDMHTDLIMSAGMLNSFEFNDIIGYATRFIAADGITIQHREGFLMEESDYPKLIKDPMKFFIEDFIPRKIPGLTIEKIIKGIESLYNAPDTSWIPEWYKSEFGLVYMIGGAPGLSSPMDLLFDSLRGIKGTLIDIRRSPQMVLDAIDALYPLCEARLGDTSIPAEPFPMSMTMFHSPTYLSKKQFEKFYAPTYDKLLAKVAKQGRKVFEFFEGDWSQHYDWLNSLPKNVVGGIVEKDDIFKMKKAVGDNITLVGGMPLNILKYESKEYCIDYAKKLIQELGPGGGYIYGLDKVLQCPGDVNAENYIACNNWVYENGYYK